MEVIMNLAFMYAIIFFIASFLRVIQAKNCDTFVLGMVIFLYFGIMEKIKEGK